MRLGWMSLGLVLAITAATPTLAGSASVAVAANFTAVAEELAAAFKADTGDDLVLSFGATGGLYTQISQGAPFEVFLAADDTRPQKAVDDGLGVDGTVFTYAEGKLALYSTSLDLTAGEFVLTEAAFDKIAIADPAAAPYGAAAIETINKLELMPKLEPKIVTGENISQTLQFVESGNAEVGFVALSQVIGKSGSHWLVPDDLYEPILQDAVLLRTGEANPVALAFLEYLKSDKARTIIKAAGYEVAQ